MKRQVCILLLPVIFAAACQAEQSLKVTVTNPLQILRDRETVTLDWSGVLKAIPDAKPEEVAVVDVATRQPVVTQFIECENGAALLFQTDLRPGQKKEFTIGKRPQDFAMSIPAITTYCRFIPERKDDFGWENDKVAFRMYGPALEYETITSGIDAWGKSVSYPIIDKFIKDYVEKKIPYHYDHGEGGDFYKVGNTLGCGGMAPLVDGKVCLPRNFIRWKILANGPIRSVFELTYAPWEAGTLTVGETKRISLDLGSNLSRIECTYNSTADIIPLAAGIILRETSDQTWVGAQTIAYWLPTDFIEGNMGCGVVFGPETKTVTAKADGHLLLTLSVKPQTPVVYYAGSCWDKNKEFDTFTEWQQYLIEFKQRLDSPVLVEMQP
jgi:hypothetical protein